MIEPDNLGFGGTSQEVAKEVLVFMIVGTTGHWKMPIAYYCINGLPAEIQKDLVLYAIDELESVGILVSLSLICPYQY